MLRPSANNNLRTIDNGGNDTPKKYDNAKSKESSRLRKVLGPLLVVIIVFGAFVIYDKRMADITNNSKPAITSNVSPVASRRASENAAFKKIITRSISNRQHCQSIDSSGENIKEEFSNLMINNHTAHLPPFGFLEAVRKYEESDPKSLDQSYPYQCELPPDNECGESQFTVIFMAYNPDRLQKLLAQAKTMLTDPEYSKSVAEVLIVWNGHRDIHETPLGKQLVELGTKQKLPLRVSYPLKAGFPNDLMNRYHPRLEIKTKAILYYDDDGPFYAHRAVLGGFELWKRNSNAQIGAMARKIDLGDRQAAEQTATAAQNKPDHRDRFFVSHCPADAVNYNYFTFANFDARMVLPSGSFLHSNYLCFLWHPIFEDIRDYVRKHPVNPDDGTVSMLVSQLGGRAPKVYSRRLPFEDNNKSKQGRRRLMDGIDWDNGGGHDKKMHWGRLRSDAANSLARYFGSINSGSLGWCYGTKYHTKKKKEDLCQPEMARVGMLPWMNSDNSPKDTCP